MLYDPTSPLPPVIFRPLELLFAAGPSDDAGPKHAVPVLHLINGQHFSGAERVQDLLGLNLPNFGFSVGFACLKPDRFPAMRRSQDCRLYEVGMRHKWNLSVVRKLEQLVRQKGYELLHAHTPRTAMIGAMLARRTGLPLIYHVHSPVGRDSTRRWANWLNPWVERWSIRRAAHLVTVSHSLATYMKESMGVSERTITVVPNGVPVPQRQRGAQSPTEPWTIGTMALFRPRKGTEDLLRAMALLRDRGRLVRLCAVGDFESSDYEREIKQLAVELGIADQVQWTGFTRQVDTALATMDLFVLPSRFGEGLPMVVLEAMAAGVPVVATRVEGVPEAIRDGRDGILAEPANPDDLSRCIEQFVCGTVDWLAMRSSGLKRHAGHFSDAAMARGIAAVYQSVLGN